MSEFFAWLPQDLHDVPGIDWTGLSSQAAGYLVRNVASADAAYMAMAAAATMGQISNDSLLRLLRALHALLQRLRTLCGVQDLSDLHSERIWSDFALRTQMTAYRRAHLAAYAAVASRHFPAYLERLGTEERGRMQRYALPSLPLHFLKPAEGGTRREATGEDRQRSPQRAAAAQRRQLKEQQASAYITERCHETPDVTCQELREGLKSKGIRMSPKRVNGLRSALDLRRPSGSRAAHLRSSSVHPQARAWLAQQRHLDPDRRVSTLQAGLRETFQIDIGTRQLNNVLRELGVSRPGPHRARAEEASQ